MFAWLYARVMHWARHPHAPRYLVGLSFAESSFFPVPPDVMLAPMALARPERAWRYALLTTLGSVLGGLFGYLIGTLAFEAIQPVLHAGGYWDDYQRASAWFDTWGFWAVFLAGFSPIPYKIFTLTAGVIAMPVLPFVLASVLSRGARFFLVAGLMVWGGVRMEQALHRYVNLIGWVTVALALAVYLIVRN